MKRTPLHGPTAEDRRWANAKRPALHGAPGGIKRNTALRLASCDSRVPALARALARTVSAYNRAPPRLLLDNIELPGLAAGLLPPLGRWLALRAIGQQQAQEHLAVARGAAVWSFGWIGSFALAVTWIAVLLLLVQALVPNSVAPDPLTIVLGFYPMLGAVPIALVTQLAG